MDHSPTAGAEPFLTGTVEEVWTASRSVGYEAC